MLIEEQFQLRKCSEVKDQTKPEKRMFMEYWSCWSAVRNVQERRWVVRRFRHVARFWEVVWHSLHVPGNFMPAETLGKPSFTRASRFCRKIPLDSVRGYSLSLACFTKEALQENIVWLKTLHLKHSRKLNDKVQPQISKAPWIFIMCSCTEVSEFEMYSNLLWNIDFVCFPCCFQGGDGGGVAIWRLWGRWV